MPLVRCRQGSDPPRPLLDLTRPILSIRQEIRMVVVVAGLFAVGNQRAGNRGATGWLGVGEWFAQDPGELVASQAEGFKISKKTAVNLAGANLLLEIVQK